MNLNLILAVVWFVVGLCWLTATSIKGDLLPVIHFGGLEFSPAWVALLLCGYNLVRWWLRPRRRSQNSLDAALEARRRLHRAEERQQGTPDPTFNFTDSPPASPNPQRPDPPSTN